jgi:iron(III) transport system permease protein
MPGRILAGLRGRFGTSAVLITLLVIMIGFVVLFPVAQIVIQSFRISNTGEAEQYGWSGWQALFSEASLVRAMWNTLSLALVYQSIALVAAVFVAWLLARTDVPFARGFEFAFWLAFFLPSLTVTLSWILLLDPQFGLVNQALRGLVSTLFGWQVGDSGPFDIYSFMGIVWVHLMTTSIAFKVMILTPTFRNANSAFEDASRISGASDLTTLTRIFVPLMLPAIVAIEFLALLAAVEAFEIEQILGTRFNFYVISTWIYWALNQHTPRFDVVSALAVVMILFAIGLIFVQRRLIARRQYTTITGQFQAQKIALGGMRWPAFAFLATIVVLIVVVPLVFSLMGTFMKLFGFFIPEPWTLNQWQTALRDRQLLRALQNTLVMALGAAGCAIVIHSVIAYVCVRTRYFARGALDFVSWLPFTVPGILLSLALLSMFLTPLFRAPFGIQLYGTLPTLILALVIAGMPLGVQTMKSNLVQLGNELEEASWVVGGNWFHTYRHVVLPLISPTLVILAVITFISAARNISQVALLSNGAIQPLAVLQLGYLVEGKYEVAAVIATILGFVSVGLALLVRIFGYKGVASST